MCMPDITEDGDGTMPSHGHVHACRVVSGRMRLWRRRRRVRGRRDGIYVATDGRAKPSPDHRDRQTTHASRIFRAIAFRFTELVCTRPGWFISHAYVELIWWTLPVRTVCQAAFRHLIAYLVRALRSSLALPSSATTRVVRGAVVIVHVGDYSVWYNVTHRGNETWLRQRYPPISIIALWLFPSTIFIQSQSQARLPQGRNMHTEFGDTNLNLFLELSCLKTDRACCYPSSASLCWR